MLDGSQPLDVIEGDQSEKNAEMSVGLFQLNELLIIN